MKIFLDFDDTIFNTKRFKKDYLQLFLSHGISRQEFDTEYYTEERGKIRGTLKRYDPDDQIKRLEMIKRCSFNSLRLEIRKFLADLGSYVFDDFYHFVRYFPKENIYLISYGDKKFQKRKIYGSKVDQFFANIIITETSKGSELWKVLEKAKHDGGEIAFIDDRPDQLREVRREVKNIIPIRLIREEGRYGHLRSPHCCIECRNLLEAEKILRN